MVAFNGNSNQPLHEGFAFHPGGYCTAKILLRLTMDVNRRPSEICRRSGAPNYGIATVSAHPWVRAIRQETGGSRSGTSLAATTRRGGGAIDVRYPPIAAVRGAWGCPITTVAGSAS